MAQTNNIEDQALDFFKTYGIDISLCTPEVQKLLIDYYRLGAEESIRNLLILLRDEQQNKPN